MQLETGRRPTGRWRWDVRRALWTWDDVTRELLGYDGPEATVPLRAALAAVLVSDRPGVQRLVADLERAPEEFATVLRVQGHDGLVTPVVLVGRPADVPADLPADLADDLAGSALVGVAIPLAAPYDIDVEAASTDDLIDQAEHLRRAIATRDDIGQAKGILSARLGIADDDAFEFLRRLSQHTNIKLADVAQRFVAHVLARPEVGPDDRARFHRDVLEPFLEAVRTKQAER